jgi:hypothetical protein
MAVSINLTQTSQTTKCFPPEELLIQDGLRRYPDPIGMTAGAACPVVLFLTPCDGSYLRSNLAQPIIRSLREVAFMEFEQVSCRKETQQEPPPKSDAGSLHQEAYEKSAVYPVPPPVPFPPFPGTDVITQEAVIVGNILDSGNARLAAARLQADLIQLRPNRYYQNLLLSQVDLCDRKGFGSDLSLGYYNPYRGGFMHAFIKPSIYQPLPTYPVYY